jgi:leucyl aminopeptidase (aminopeptidase T)
MNQLGKSAMIALRDCMGAKAGETVLVVTDDAKIEIGRAIYEAAKELGCEPLMLLMPPGHRNGQEPPGIVAEAMKHADVVLCPTSKSLSHTNARHDACKNGARIATLPGITVECMARTLGADYSAVKERTERLVEAFKNVESVRITAAAGTDITMSIKGRSFGPDTGIITQKGGFGNLPAGEAYIAPLEGTANGIVVIDGAMAGYGVPLVPIVMTVRDGFAVSIDGPDDIARLNALIDPLGFDTRNIAELGIGTNDQAIITGLVLEDEKVMGTIHIAIGDNSHFGGNVSVPSHLDGIVKSPTIWADGKLIMENGKLLV